MTRNTHTPSPPPSKDLQGNLSDNTSGFLVKDVSFSYGQKPLFKNLSVVINRSEFCSVVGPNGAGKSTFLKLLTRLLEPQVGQILLDNQPLADYSHRDLARKITYVPQESFFAWDFTVEETVLQGRYSYLRPLERYHSSDFDRVHAALGRLGIETLVKKGINNISSGERQLAVIARSLVQEPSIILLDEPLNHLDLAHQYQVLSLLSELNSEGIGIVLVAHDLNQASMVSNRMVVFSSGTLVEDGDPSELLTPVLVERYWGIKPLEGRHPESGKSQIFLPLR